MRGDSLGMDKITRWLIAAAVLILCAITILYGKNRNSSGNISNCMNAPQYVEQAKNYLIYEEDELFFCYIYDADGQIVKTDGPFSKRPHIKIIDDFLLRVSWQAGTGLGTQFAYYYDIEKSRLSKTFQSVFDEFGGNVVYCTAEKVIVRNIFDEEPLYCEISEFEKPFSDVAFPFINVFFIAEGTRISVTYLSGETYEQITEEKRISDYLIH